MDGLVGTGLLTLCVSGCDWLFADDLLPVCEDDPARCTSAQLETLHFPLNPECQPTAPLEVGEWDCWGAETLGFRVQGMQGGSHFETNLLIDGVDPEKSPQLLITYTSMRQLDEYVYSPEELARPGLMMGGVPIRKASGDWLDDSCDCVEGLTCKEPYEIPLPPLPPSSAASAEGDCPVGYFPTGGCRYQGCAEGEVCQFAEGCHPNLCKYEKGEPGDYFDGARMGCSLDCLGGVCQPQPEEGSDREAGPDSGCGSRECGNDGTGGLCGVCSGNSVCSLEGTCVSSCPNERDAEPFALPVARGFNVSRGPVCW